METQEEVAPSSVEPSEDVYRETFEGIIIEYLTLRNVQVDSHITHLKVCIG